MLLVRPDAYLASQPFGGLFGKLTIVTLIWQCMFETLIWQVLVEKRISKMYDQILI